MLYFVTKECHNAVFWGTGEMGTPSMDASTMRTCFQGGARKARRTGTQQQQQRERVDGDGDVAMGDAEVDGAWLMLMAMERGSGTGKAAGAGSNGMLTGPNQSCKK
eukprot:532910-Pelagomonas_calceolata.AAC.6